MLNFEENRFRRSRVHTESHLSHVVAAGRMYDELNDLVESAENFAKML